MNLLLLVLLIVLIFGGGYGWHSGWGAAPVGGLGTIVLVLVLLWACGVIR